MGHQLNKDFNKPIWGSSYAQRNLEWVLYLKMSTYSEMLKHPKWQKKRLEILQRDNWCCVKCGDKETTLQIHHLKYTGKPWDAPKTDLITLCEDCHLFFTKSGHTCDSVESVVKIGRVYVNSNDIGIIINNDKITSFYTINKDKGTSNFEILFNKNSTVLEKLYKLNHGRK